MSVSNFIPTIWSDLINQAYAEASVFRPLANTSYEGEIRNFGDTVKINSINDFSTSTYSGSVTYSEIDDSSLIMQINQKKYVAKTLDDVDAAQIKPKMAGEIARNFGRAFVADVEAYIASLYTEAGITDGSTGSVTAITSANVISTVGDMASAFDENEVPDDGRVAIVPPWLAQKIVLSGVIRDTDNSSILSAGYIGQFQGFQIYKSNRISKSGTSWYAPMFFRRNDTIAMAEQINEMEALRREDEFADAMRALMVYGAKVIKPESLGVLYCSEGSESAI
jgi:hypothetical protein